ncbi:hypothetical protein AAFF_G00202260 [Aldrovandia affinis]|uniref:TLDc domain-containing protein n=1 Tax=Aldrovandia affinis TaxID=143900 RepID=A0AAD7SX21_9TELE|nr:hypothetical protein AAFF_G00202260 [Aldrovandia affinis]
MSLISRLGLERERQLQKLFQGQVNLCLLYKGSCRGFGDTLQILSENQGRVIVIVYLETGCVRGAYLSKAFPTPDVFCEDPEAFIFSANEKKACRLRVRDHKKACIYHSYPPKLVFGASLQLICNPTRMSFVSEIDVIYGNLWDKESQNCVEVEVYRVQGALDGLLNPWRDVEWTQTLREELRQKLVSFKPYCEVLSRVRVLLLGPVGAGKSSFVNSIKSVMCREVCMMPCVGTIPEGFTKKLKSYEIRTTRGNPPTALTLCDIMALRDSMESGLTLHDTLAVIKGHVPEGHKFQSEAPISPDTTGYRQAPTLEEKIHCVVFVLDACEVLFYSKSLKDQLKDLRSEISDMDIPHMILLTHVDQVCHAVEMDVQYVYRSHILQDRIQKAAEVVGLPVSYVLPVKNYASELSVNCNTDILLLSALSRMLHSIDNAFEDYAPSPQEVNN